MLQISLVKCVLMSLKSCRFLAVDVWQPLVCVFDCMTMRCNFKLQVSWKQTGRLLHILSDVTGMGRSHGCDGGKPVVTLHWNGRKRTKRKRNIQGKQTALYWVEIPTATVSIHVLVECWLRKCFGIWSVKLTCRNTTGTNIPCAVHLFRLLSREWP